MSVSFLFRLVAVCSLMFVMLGGCSKKSAPRPDDSPYRRAIGAMDSSNYDEAFQRIDEAIAVDRGEGRDSALAGDYIVRGYLSRLTAGYDSAVAHYERAIAIGHALGDKWLQRTGKTALAELYVDARMYDHAEQEAAGAATLSVLQGDWRPAAGAFILQAKALHGLTRYAMEERVLDSLARIDSAWLQKSNADTIARQRVLLYRDWHNEPLLRAAITAWRSDAEARHDTAALIDAVLLWGETLEGMGQRDSAGRAYAEALTLTSMIQDGPRQIRVLSNLGNLALAANRLDNATRYYREALNNATRGKYFLSEEMLRLQLVACDWLGRKSNPKDTTRFDQQIERIRQSYPQTGLRAAEAYAIFLRARMQERRNQPAAALRSYAAALDLYEKDGVLRDPDTDIGRFVTAFMNADGSNWYDTPMALACAVLDGRTAWVLHERRNLDDLASFFEDVVPGVTGERATAIAAAQHQIHFRQLAQRDLYNELQHGERRNTVRMQKILEAGYGGEADTLQIPQAIPTSWQMLLGMQHFNPDVVQDSLPASSALIEYIPAPGMLYSLVVRTDTIVVRSAQVERARLQSLMGEYARQVTLSDSLARLTGIGQVESRVTTLSAILGSMFVNPVLPLLNGVRKIYIVQSAEIGWLPVHTLNEGSLAAKYTVSYLPSAQSLLGPPPPVKPVARVAAFGYQGSSSWDVEYELKDIWAFYKEARMRFDTAATVRALTDSAWDALAICTTFELNTEAPGESYLVTANAATPTIEQRVPIGVLYGMPVSQSVVFSNVAAAAGGMYRYVPALILANGTSSVVASMWQGDRKAKKYFGEVFYTSLATAMPLPEAYHEAMSKMTSAAEYASPRLYGVYYLFGK